MIANRKILLWVPALLIALLSLPGWCQEKHHDITIQFVRSTSAPGKYLFDAKTWYSKTDSSSYTVIAENVFQVRDGKDSLLHIGRKEPIVYKDPRADGYQVQYTDQGLKCDITVTKLSNGLLKVQVRPEHSIATPTEAFPDGVQCMITETTFVMKSGQTVILGTTQGLMNRIYQTKVGGGPGGVLLFALSIE